MYSEILTATETNVGAGPWPIANPKSDGADSREQTLSVAVVAVNEVVRRGVAAMLRAVSEIETTFECAHVGDLSTLIRLERLDAVLVTTMDVVGMRDLRGALADMGVVVLVVGDRFLVEEISCYASVVHGFLWLQDLTPEGLGDALRRSRHGEIPMPANLARGLLARSAAVRQAPKPVSLTGREREVVALLVKGYSNKQIAKTLSISSHGAKRLVTSVLLKLGAPNRTMAAVTAVREGIVDGQ